MFRYPYDLVELIKTSWKENKTISEHFNDLPSDNILEELLEIAYHSDFMTEESRRVRFSLILCPKNDDVITANYGEIVFDKNRDFSIVEIFRLAPATDPSNVLIGVEADENSDLKIWGLLNIGSSWRNFIRGESGTAFLPPGFLTISCSEPGNLIISCAGVMLIDLRHGRYYKPTVGIFNEGFIADFFKESKEKISLDVLEKLDDENIVEEDIKNDFKKASQIFLERILIFKLEKNVKEEQ